MDYDYTVAINQNEPRQPAKQAYSGPGSAPPEARREETASGLFVNPPSPVLGWVVCANGASRGRGLDAPLVKGVTHIGKGMDIDPEALGLGSGGIHLVITYDAAGNGFYIRQEGGEAAALYAGGQGAAALTGAARLGACDVVVAGAARLAFVPFCEGSRRWD